MKSYRVRWEIDLYARSPKDAAKKALAIQRDPASWAVCFDVFPVDGGGNVDESKKKVPVDLMGRRSR